MSAEEVNVNPLVNKFQAAIAACNAATIGREAVVEGIWTALLANENVALLGAAGTAKSELVGNVARCFGDASYFPLLMGKFTMPEELCGPFDVEGFKQGRYNRLVEGYMPAAHIAFLDEGFKANPSLLNTLLTMCNERKYDNGQPYGRVDIPLRATIIASNEIPEGSDMDPLWDRFMVRFWITSLIADESKAAQLFGLNYPVRTEDRRRSRTVVNLPDVDKLTIEELDHAQVQVSHIPFTDAGAQALMAVRAAILDTNPELLTDRSFTRWPNLARACAWLTGCDAVGPEHLIPLADTCWREPAQQGLIVDAVYKFAAPVAEKLSLRVRSALDIWKEFPKEELASSDEMSLLSALKSASMKLKELARIEKDAEELAGTNMRHRKSLDEIRGIRKKAQEVMVKAKDALTGGDNE